MKRITPIVLILGLLGGACGEETRTALPGGVGEPRSVSIAGDLLFVSAPVDDALRVLELPTADRSGAFVRAPNPLFSLQIPAVRRPGETLTLDPGGARPVVMVASTLDAQVRLVDPVTLEPLGAPIPVPGRPVQMTRLPDGRTAVIALETPEAATPGSVALVTLDPQVFDPAAAPAPDASVVLELTELPVEAVPGGVAVTEAAGALEAWVSDLRAAELVRLDLETGAQTRLAAGRVIGRLEASPAVEAVEPPLPEGAYVYGVVAGAAEALAFDVAAGALAPELTYEGALLPIPLPSIGVDMVAIPAVTVRGQRVSPSGVVVNVSLDVPVLLLVAMIDGDVLYAHGTRMRPIDPDADLEVEPSYRVSPRVLVQNSDGTWTDEPDPTAPILVTEPVLRPREGEPPRQARVDLTPGVTRTRTWTVGWKASLPRQTDVLGRVEILEGDVRLVPLYPPADLAERVAVGDTVRIEDPPLPEPSEEAEADACAPWRLEEDGALTYEITAVAADGLVLGPVEGGAPLPTEGCFPVPFAYTAAAGGFTVTATGLDPVWRIQPGDIFVYEGERFLKPDRLVIGPEIRFGLAETQPSDAWPPGVARIIEVEGGADPRLMEVQGSTLIDPLDPYRRRVIGSGFLPGLMDYSKGQAGFGSARVYVPYGHCDCLPPPGFVLSFDATLPTSQRVFR